jgi:exonuclease III
LELWSKGIAREGVLLYDIDATVKEISSDDCGRILSCELKYENKTYIITNVYCPNDSGVRKTFIRDIDPYVTDGSLTEKMHILTGDFNCVLDKEIYRYPSRNYDHTGGKELKTIIQQFDFFLFFILLQLFPMQISDNN